MKASEITTGGFYKANVSGVVVTVQVKAIRKAERLGKSRTVYDVTNTRTGRQLTFDSAARFRSTALPPATKEDTAAARSAFNTARQLASDIEQNKFTLPAADKAVSGFAAAMQNRGRVGAGDDSPHLIVKARAGTGKTTTIIEGLKVLKGLPTRITPSEQQRAIWDAMAMSKGKVSTIGVVAFNRSIATELKERVPFGVDAMTNHSLGLKAVRQVFKLLPGDKGVTAYRVNGIIAELLGKNARELQREQPLLVGATKKLVSLCKMNLTPIEVPGEDDEAAEDVNAANADALESLASHYDVDLVSDDGRQNVRSAVFDLVPRVLERCKDVARDACVDYDDMIWLPIALNLPVVQYDMLLVDESQDLNRCQQALVKRAGRRLVFVGDDRQAIYGFAGADAESLDRLQAELTDTDRGCTVLPLTMTRRCGRAIVDAARDIVPDFEAHESNGKGSIRNHTFKPSFHTIGDSTVTSSYHDAVSDGDMILCRVNAPLVSECFKFIKAGRKANIQGRDIGEGLAKLVTKLSHGNPATPVSDFLVSLEEWAREETEKEQNRKNPNESKIIAIDDKYGCLACFTEGAKTVGDVLSKINTVFTDERSGRGILLSSVHKAKGLESKRVFILLPERGGMPHPMAKSDWQRKQEMNLKYVAITRAIEELVWVS